MVDGYVETLRPLPAVIFGSNSSKRLGKYKRGLMIRGALKERSTLALVRENFLETVG